MTVWELEHRMPSRELSEWMAYYSLEPFGSQRADYRASMISATVVNAAGPKKPVQPFDFIKPFRPTPRRVESKEEYQTEDFDSVQRQQMAIFAALARKQDE